MRKLFFLVALFLPLSASAQDADFFSTLHDVPEGVRAFARIMVNPVMRAVLEEGADRTGVFVPLLLDGPPLFPGLKDELGVTREHMNQFRESMNALMKGLENPEVFRELEKNIHEDSNHVPTDETLAEIESLYRFACEQANTAAAESFTEEQMQLLDNAVFGITGGLQSPFLNERHMDALGMTDEQRAQFKKINEETRPEREKMMATFDADIQKMLKTGKFSVKDILGAMAKFQTLGSTLRKRRSAVLTPSQLAKAKEMARLPKSMTWSVFDWVPVWTPGPNSWQPGDPLPVEVPPRPPGNFPRKKEQPSE